MKDFLHPLAVVLALNMAGPLSAQPSVVAAAYGEPANYMAGILEYPDFTVRYASRTEHTRNDSRIPWVTQTFEVLKRDGRTIGGDITFNADRRMNGRRFDVDGKIYIAEFHRSTADLPGSKKELAPDRIAIWDEASARAHNPKLHAIWSRESIEPQASYSSQHAYADGDLLPEYAPEKEVTRVGPGMRPTSYDSNSLAGNVPLAARARRAPWDTATPCAYGERIIPRQGAVRTPDICVQLTQRVNSNPADPDSAHTTYHFIAFDRAGNESFPVFQTINMANGYRLELGGKVYFMEMFATTATGGDARSKTLPLPEAQVVIWNEEAARRGNPAILPALSPKTGREAGSRGYAGGVALGPPFNSSRTIGPLDQYSRTAELDQPLLTVSRGSPPYPEELAGSGFIGFVGGFLMINADGTLEQAVASHGNDRRFEKPVHEALSRFRFAPPLKDGRPVKVYVRFRWRIFESASDGSGLEFL